MLEDKFINIKSLLMSCTMYSESVFECVGPMFYKESRSHSAQGLGGLVTSPTMKIPLPPRMWITDVEDESSDGSGDSVRDDGLMTVDRPRVRSRFRHYKQRSNIPIGIFWDIENCQVPRGCSAIDVVAAIRNKFLTGGRREADFVVVCDVRKESVNRLQELNDSQISLIHVCGTQKNAADEKLRQCMRRFGELHTAPAALLLISGDINFAADLSDFRHRKNMEVILVHKRNTSSALIACASSHYCYNELTAHLPRNPKTLSQTEEDETPSCEMEVANLPVDQPPERVTRRLRRLADNCGGKVIRVNNATAVLRFPTPDHASRALKRMDGEDVFGRKISTRYATAFQPAYSSDEGYSTAPAAAPPRPASGPPRPPSPHQLPAPSYSPEAGECKWALALQALPARSPPAVPRPRRIRGTHGSVSLDRSGCSSSNSGDDSRREASASRAVSPWNCSGYSEQGDDDAELTVTNLPPYEPLVLQEMLTSLFSQYVQVVRVSVWAAADGPLASVVLRSEWDARLAIARIHKRRLDNQWSGRRLELSLGRPTPAPNLDVLRARLRAILLDQKSYNLPLLRLRDAYASRHCCALTTSDLAKVKDTVVIHDGFGRMVQLLDLTPVSNAEMEEAPWKCHIHAGLSTSHEDGSRILQPVFIEISVLNRNVQILLENHGGILPLLSFVECYETTFQPLVADPRNGVALELLLRSAPGFEVRDAPSRHLAAATQRALTPSTHSHLSDSSRSSGDRDRPRTAPVLEPMLALFERELIDLLRSAPRCCIPFSKLIPAFHHHFGRQCRVADYGFTKLPDLLAALGNTIVVLGSGSSRVITISAAAQGRRWTSDLTKLLKSQPGRAISPHDIPLLYQTTFGRPFSPADYGVCTLRELMQRVTPQSVIVSADGSISLPRRTPTPDERARTVQFAMQVFGQRLRALAPLPLAALPAQYSAQFGAVPQPEVLDVSSLEAMVYACGGSVEAGVVRAPGDSPSWASAALAACAVLTADRSVARGSTQEYFESAFRRLRGSDPELHNLEAAGVVEVCDRRVLLSATWRGVWRVASILADRVPRTAAEILHEYSRRHDPNFCVEMGVEGMSEFLVCHGSVFASTGGRWALRGGVLLPALAHPAPPQEDYSVHDTPPGQKGSRVFESPKVNIWCSPPASALPAPTALLAHDNKRRIRLAAHFDSA
ncbi:meiosis regulator and mRNA stability factor 1 isoform X2 [Pectinophora gossypiella]|uniref:meiosis regulator and mRNA stability factor 1 isoform X2 n=1 Tax=Pectinophora gossypiella TaxID=13191 RepID=UPI00214EB91F|nr:meiosis regulator and mRNA stability factor 1 isoform X2 [Pectinophora gossypiella]